MSGRGNSNSRGPEAGASLVGCRDQRGQRFRKELSKGRVESWASTRGLAVIIKVQRDREGGRGPLTLPVSLQSMESQVEEWYREVGELQAQTAALPLEPASKELVGERQNAVGERLVRLLEPLQERRRLLLASKELHQVAHDLEDELVRIRAGIWGGARVRGGAREGGRGQRAQGVETGVGAGPCLLGGFKGGDGGGTYPLIR